MVAQKLEHFCTSYNFIKYWQISKLFLCRNQENIHNNTATKDLTTTQMSRYTTLWNISVLKATTKNETTFVTAHFQFVVQQEGEHIKHLM